MSMEPEKMSAKTLESILSHAVQAHIEEQWEVYKRDFEAKKPEIIIAAAVLSVMGLVDMHTLSDRLVITVKYEK